MGARLLPPILALLLTPATARAQQPSDALPEPRLFDTPWGDFPIERLQPGARLRLVSVDGRRMEVRLASLRDSILDLRSAGGVPVPPQTFEDLRALRRVEVRAIPRWRDRAGNIGFIAGAVLGALAGVARHNSGGRVRSDGRQASLGENVAAHASVGSFVGWMTGRAVIGRARWRPVTLP